MAPTIPAVAPSEFRAGDTVRFTRTLADFPASAGWVVKYVLNGVSKVIVTASSSGDDHSFTMPATQSATLQPGTYTWVITAELSGARYTAEGGTVAVLADVLSAGAGALQSQDEKELALLNAEIAARAASDHTEYSIEGRSLKREALTELLEWRDLLRSRIARRRRGGRIATVSAHFTGVSE